MFTFAVILLFCYSMREPAYLGQINLQHTNAMSEDLQRAIISQHKKAVAQVKTFAQKFKGKNDIATAYNVWHFMRKNFRYKRNEAEKQLIFLPSAALHFKHSGFDCKTFATFAASIFTALGISNGFRFTSYKSRTIPSHIYNYIRLSNGTTLPMDGCYKFFGTEKKPTFVKNIRLK